MADREISREEAIKRLEEGAPFSELYDSRWEVALALAIKALKAEPVVRCKDCIHYWNNAKNDEATFVTVCLASPKNEHD